MTAAAPPPGPELFGPRRPLPARKVNHAALPPAPLRCRPFEVALAAHPDADPPRTMYIGCTGGGRYVKASYVSEAAALTQTVVAAAKGYGQGAWRHYAVYGCQDHWHMTGYGEREPGNVWLATPAPSLAHPRPNIIDTLTRV